MIRFGPSVDDARTIEDVEFIDPWTIAAVPVPVLFSAAQGAMACGAWAEARDLLMEVVSLEPGFEQDGQSARELLAEARRAYARATRRKRLINPWPVLISAAALVLVPVAAGLATAAFGSNAAVSAPAVFEAVPASAVTVPTVMPTLPVVGLPLPTVEPATATEMPSLPIVVAPLPTVAPAPPTRVPPALTVAPALSSTPEPTVAERDAASLLVQSTLIVPTEQSAPMLEATPAEDVIRQPPAKQNVTR